MKTTHLITICSILLLSSQTYSQESVAGGGMGGSDFGNVNLDVPEEGQQDEPNRKILIKLKTRLRIQQMIRLKHPVAHQPQMVVVAGISALKM